MTQFPRLLAVENPKVENNILAIPKSGSPPKLIYYPSADESNKSPEHDAIHWLGRYTDRHTDKQKK
jgi:hypothetical protein